jgi:hypothetical protein
VLPAAEQAIAAFAKTRVFLKKCRYRMDAVQNVAGWMPIGGTATSSWVGSIWQN